MAQYNNLIAAIKAAIRTNGSQAITAAIHQDILLQVVGKLGAAYQVGGVVVPTDIFDSATFGDVNIIYVACTPGHYHASFGGFSLLPGQVALFIYDGSWKKQIISYYGNDQVYGIRHYYNNSSPDLTRIGAAALHQELPVQSQMRRCVVDSTGAVKYYLSGTDSTKKADGTAANLTGADGQVMVEIPAHYRKCSLNSAQGYMDVEISLYPFEGAIPVPRYLVGAYEASLDRNNNLLSSVVNKTAAFRGGNNNADWDGTYRSLLGLPATSINLSSLRQYGRNRGTGWGCYDWNAHLAIYWLFSIEYATLNSQKGFTSTLTSEGFHQGGLGPSVSTFFNWSTYNSILPFIPCGITNSLGNNTGVVTFTLTPEQAEAYGSGHSEIVPSYRGIENPFGHIWKWADGSLGKGVNGEYQEIYVSRDPSQYASAINDSYVDMGRKAKAVGFCNAIIASDPSRPQEQRVYGDIFDRDNSGSNNTFFCDYRYQNNVNNTIYGLVIGGRADSSTNNGLACLSSLYETNTAHPAVGSRLCWSE